MRGTKDGRQVRREFGTRQDAVSFAEQQNSATDAAKPVELHAQTNLKLEELREAEAVVHQLQREFPGVSLPELLDFYRALAPVAPLAEARQASSVLKTIRSRYSDATLSLVGDWFLTNYRTPSTRLPLRVALEHYLTDAARRLDTRSLSKPQFERIGRAMTELENHFRAETPLGSITTGRIHEYLRTTTKGRVGATGWRRTVARGCAEA